MPAPSPIDRLDRLSQESLCIGCGICEGISPEGSIRVLRTPAGALRPIADNTLTDAIVDKVYRLCPGTTLEGLPKGLAGRDAQNDLDWGIYNQMVKGHAGDPELRFKAAAGGALSALALHLLDTQEVAFVLHAKASKNDPSFGVMHISRTREDVLAGSGSRYGPTATLIEIDRILSMGEPFAFIGTPCDVTALRNLAKEDPRVNTLCRMMMAPVCGGFMQTPALAKAVERFGLSFDALSDLRYRGYGCPGPTRMEDRHGQVIERSYLDFWGEDDSAWSLPWRCKICSDGIGDAADIAASDCWPGGAPTKQEAEQHDHDPGSNGVIIRSERAKKMVDAAIASGAFVVEETIGPAEMSLWQPHQVRKKQLVGARLDALRQAGRIVPQTRGLRIAEQAAAQPSDVLAQETAGTLARLRAGKASEPPPSATSPAAAAPAAAETVSSCDGPD